MGETTKIDDGFKRLISSEAPIDIRPEAAGWYVVKTKPLVELFARENLMRDGLAVFLPRYQKTRRHARRTEVVLRPLFPGYLFVSFRLADDGWRRIPVTHGVERLICAGEVPLRVPAREIEGLRARCEGEHEVMPVPDPAANYEPGQRLKFVEGPFLDHVALYVGHERECVTLLLDLMGRTVRLTRPVYEVAAAV